MIMESKSPLRLASKSVIWVHLINWEFAFNKLTAASWENPYCKDLLTLSLNSKFDDLNLKIKINLRVAPSEALKSHLLSMGALSIN